MYWGDERPKEIDERCLKGPKVTALCALNAKKGMLWPYWFEDSRGRTVTVNGERNREVLNRINEDQSTVYTKPKEIFVVPARWCNSPYSTCDYGPFAHIVWKQNLELASRARMVSA